MREIEFNAVEKECILRIKHKRPENECATDSHSGTIVIDTFMRYQDLTWKNKNAEKLFIFEEDVAIY